MTTSGFAQAVAGLAWTTEFELLDGHATAQQALARVLASPARWFVVSRFNGFYLYAFSRAELLAVLAPGGGMVSSGFGRVGQDNVALETALDLHEDQGSQKAHAGEPLAAADPQAGALPSRARFVEVDAQGQPVAVGGTDVATAPRRMRGRAAAAEPSPQPAGSAPPDAAAASPGAAPTDAAPSMARGAAPPSPASAEPFTPAMAAPAATPQGAPRRAVADDDEGTTPVRHPSIEADAPLRAGKTVTLTIDLLAEASTTTAGGALTIGGLEPTWDTLTLGVTLACSAIVFDDDAGRTEVTIRRNQASIAGTVKGTVLDTLRAGDTVEVHAQFWQGIRCCGAGVRRFVVAGAARRTRGSSAAAAPPPAQPKDTDGAIAVDPQAAEPDLTVYISLFDPDQPSRMHWRLVTPPFDTLPAKLTGIVNLGADPKGEAAALFKEFALLKRGEHRRAIEGFGERLWKRAPPEFHAAYWALVDHYQRPLAIQFVSDDPYLPWELMRPSRPGESHEPLALRHAVARWIGAYQGWLRNRLPSGEMLVIAPRYSQLAARLSKAEDTAQSLLAHATGKGYAARPLAGTRAALLDLLEQPPPGPVALLYFTGHGLFNDQMPTASAIKLERGESLAADEVDREEVALGQRDGTVVFFNACEVGATAGAIGEVGGWAGALLARRFRAFIAPLWAVDEEDASVVTVELIEQIVVQRKPIGAALRDLRKTHGATSPTFYSYILYGDVTARFGA